MITVFFEKTGAERKSYADIYHIYVCIVLGSLIKGGYENE